MSLFYLATTFVLTLELLVSMHIVNVLVHFPLCCKLLLV